MVSTRARVDDPQVEEFLGRGGAVELHLKLVGVSGLADLEVRQGRFRVDVSFGKLR
jgi:hypothetical protein